MSNLEALHARAKALGLHGVLAHWNEVGTAEWVEPLLEWEEQERGRRSLERRLRNAHIGRFKQACDFDWSWPKRCDRAAFEALMTLDFLSDAANVVLLGPNGIGKTTLARNIAYQAVIHGHTVLFTTAGQMLGDLAALAALSAPSFHAHDRVMHAGLIAWDDGWHVTPAGWQALDIATST